MNAKKINRTLIDYALSSSDSKTKGLFGFKKWCICISFSVFYIQNFEFEHKKKKKNSFSHLVVFGKLFWIHNLGIKYIISGFGHCFLFFIFFKKSKFSHLHTITSLKKSNFVFSQYLQICHCIHIHGKWKRWKVVFIFLYSNPTFRVLKMKTEYKC